MMHPHTERRFVSRAKGMGVFATQLIPKGTVTWILDDQDQPLDDFTLPAHWTGSGPTRERTDPDARFLYQDKRGRLILLHDHARYVNHSCSPNTAGGRDDRFNIAIRDIAEGEELTEDYGELAAFQPFACGCGAPECRGRIKPLLGSAGLLHEDAVKSALEAMLALPSQPLALPMGCPEFV